MNEETSSADQGTGVPSMDIHNVPSRAEAEAPQYGHSQVGASEVTHVTESFHTGHAVVARSKAESNKKPKLAESRKSNSSRTSTHSNISTQSARVRRAIAMSQLQLEVAQQALEISQIQNRFEHEEEVVRSKLKEEKFKSEMQAEELKHKTEMRAEELNHRERMQIQDVRRQRAFEENEASYRRHKRELELQSIIHIANAEIEAQNVACNSAPTLAQTAVPRFAPAFVGNTGRFPPPAFSPPNAKYAVSSMPSTNTPWLRHPPVEAKSKQLVSSPTNLQETNIRTTLGPIVPPTIAVRTSTQGHTSGYSGKQTPSLVVDRRSALPPQEPPVFHSKESEYYKFTQAFDALIAADCHDPKRLLLYLLQYTDGPAHTMVEGCLFLDSQRGYEKARLLLEEYFGRKFQIARASVDEVISGPMVTTTDKHTLLEFSAKLTACVSTLQGMNYADEIDNMYTIQKIAKRIPEQWISGWHARADKILHVENRKLMLEDLSDFIARKTREATNFMCDDTGAGQVGTRAARPQYGSSRPTSFATPMKSPPSAENCMLCDSFHFLNQCQQFRCLPYRGKMNFVLANKLCFI